LIRKGRRDSANHVLIALALGKRRDKNFYKEFAEHQAKKAKATACFGGEDELRVRSPKEVQL